MKNADYEIGFTLKEKRYIESYGGLRAVERLLRSRGLETMADLRAPELKEVFTNIDKNAIIQKKKVVQDYMKGITIHPQTFVATDKDI